MVLPINIIPSTYTCVDLVFIKALTPLHAGVGRASGVVDSPIQRDEYNFPCVYASSIKGALKTSLLTAFMKMNKTSYSMAMKFAEALLGPEAASEESFESSIAILDSHLLTMPIRSLKGIYVYVTSASLLKRFVERLEIFEKINENNLKAEEVSAINNLINAMKKLVDYSERILPINEAICIGNKKDIVVKDDKTILVEEVILSVKEVSEIDDLKSENEILKNFVSNRIEEGKCLLLLHDDVINSVIERGLMRITRVRLKRGVKTVDEGPWTEEYLPQKAMLHTLIFYKKPSLSKSFICKIVNKENEKICSEDYFEALKLLKIIGDEEKEKLIKKQDILEIALEISAHVRKAFNKLVEDYLKTYVIFGGHETIGKGVAKIDFWR